METVLHRRYLNEKPSERRSKAVCSWIVAVIVGGWKTRSQNPMCWSRLESIELPCAREGSSKRARGCKWEPGYQLTVPFFHMGICKKKKKSSPDVEFLPKLNGLSSKVNKGIHVDILLFAKFCVNFVVIKLIRRMPNSQGLNPTWR